MYSFKLLTSCPIDMNKAYYRFNQSYRETHKPILYMKNEIAHKILNLSKKNKKNGIYP